jgi:hypothetical protein
MVHFTTSDSKKSLIEDAFGNIRGHITSARIDKNKVAPPRTSCQFSVGYLEGVINRHMEIGELAIKYGVIQRPTNTTYVYNDKKWVGRENFLNSVLEDKLEHELLIKIKDAKQKGIVVEEPIEGINEEE